MTKNYDTTKKTPFVLAQEILIRFGTSESERIRLSINEVEAIVDADGETNIIQGHSNNLDKIISLSNLNSENFELIDSTTGENIGEQMSLKDLFAAIISYVRKLQKESEANE
jgi:hypothetical protein